MLKTKTKTKLKNDYKTETKTNKKIKTEKTLIWHILELMVDRA